MSRNTKTGIFFEEKSNLRKELSKISALKIVGDDVYHNSSGSKLGILVEKSKLIKYLKSIGVNYSDFVEKKKLPDSSIIILDNEGNPNSLIIIENKFQKTPGSADEKITTGPYKRKYYLKIVNKLHIKVDFIYVLSDWFKKGYKDELEYLREENIQYFFNEIPINKIFPYTNF
jgi:hypothetical protein